MLAEVVHALTPTDGKTYIDGTFGRGGYTKAILNEAKCQVIAIDRDPDAIEKGQKMAEDYNGRLNLVQDRFSNLDQVANNLGHKTVDGVVLDIGVSSPQLDDAARGFSFQKEGPLDMRMEKTGLSAKEVVNEYDEKDLANIIWKYGDEPKSRQIAKAIIKRRPLENTLDLAAAVYAVYGKKKPNQKIDPATKTFQAIRIYVNNELEELEKGLDAAERILAENGRLVVVSFHSLEDRITKNFIRERSNNKPISSRHHAIFDTEKSENYAFKAPKKAIKPTKEELEKNPRARSARLRLAIRSTGESNAI
jgi:16S rRNA (cytosine1402-N4)-methyltransferase